ncbi:copper amine oxidase N-terminal domain-containing protein [Paenibacillus tritici]|uniref:Copper amine oxidase N-terminal domain-containing protein n=1 Tax=Paenibacillus tritici TaxID=1873425 RepID=A0ABX2DUL2_9BACL|nr:copper amine oxidase N-terminal domain-containing protein [Paenibacillus tritici]NQX48384.1 copper amine oxidase N-terminal domain-containing protein [Paenibacillus tritici]
MIKKWTISLLSSALLLLPLTTEPSYAAEVPTSTTINNGQINNGRVLVPLRAVSENLGASLQWFQADKVVKIKNGNSTIWLAANFKRVIIESAPSSETPDTPSREYVDLDTATQVIKGTTYVPLRFVSQSLGATVAWDQLSKQATVTLGNKGLVVNMETPSNQIPDKNKITDSRLKLLSDKLNQASKVSSIKNVNSTFQPYFTDWLIKSIVQNKGLNTVGTYEAPATSPIYTSKNSATLTQSVILANGLTGEDQYAEDRTVTLVFTNGTWKVDSVNKGSRVLISGFSDFHPQ